MENNEQVPQNQEAPKQAPQQTSAAPAAAGRAPGAMRRPSGGRRNFASRRKVCRLCAEHIDEVDYKQIQILRNFCTDTGKILSRRITGACAKHQRQIMRAVKINRNLSLMPYN